MKLKHETYALIFGTVYIGIMVNLLLAVACAPFLAVALLTDTAHAWPLLALTAPLCAPALVGVFAVLRGFSQEGSTAVVPTFARAWWASARRALGLAAAASAVLVVLGVDTIWVLRQAWGMLALPVLVVLMALVVGITLLALVAFAEDPASSAPLASSRRQAVRLVPAVKACAYLALRRWYLTVVSLAVLALGEAVLATSPLLALGVASAPLLYLVWANARFTLRPVLEPAATDGGRVAAARA